MDFVFWIIAIVLIVGVVWWLLNRNSSANTGGSAPGRKDGLAGGSAAASAEAAGTAGLPSAAGFGSAAEPTPPTTADDEPERSGKAGQQDLAAPHKSGVRPDAAGVPADGLHRPETQPETATEHAGVSVHEAREAPAVQTGEPLAPQETTAPGLDTERGDAGVTEGTGSTAARQAEDEWETQWSEASGSAQTANHRGATDTPTGAAATLNAEAPEVHETTHEAGQGTGYVHHAEYTDPHAPTLPGAETAAADALTADAAADAPESLPAGGEPTVEPTAPTAGNEPAMEPIGHLAADQPYGAGSASPGPDGSGPADFDVKGDAGAMVYYEEGHPDYEQTTADVWFESAAHAEAAGFRAPRRTRL